MKTVVLGASKGMGRALTRQLAARGDELFLLGRDDEELARTVADLQARAPATRTIGTGHCDLAAPDGFAAALQAADEHLGGFDCVIVTAAQFATQDALEKDPDLVQQVTTLNYANTVVFCEHARKRLLARGGGSLVVFSSVAGDRGRKPVAIYGSTKAGLSHYLESLDHKYRAAGLVTLCVKPGFVKTGMTAGLKPPPFAGDPDRVASDVIHAIEQKRAVLYTPAPWASVMFVIRHLPRAVMRRLNF